jgi:hypothetical protein
MLLTSTLPRRTDASPLAATRYPIVPLPCPLAPVVKEIHEAALDAVHVQSRVVVTASEPVAPEGGASPVISLATVTWHLSAEGADTSIEREPPPHARVAMVAAQAANS